MLLVITMSQTYAVGAVRDGLKIAVVVHRVPVSLKESFSPNAAML